MHESVCVCVYVCVSLSLSLPPCVTMATQRWHCRSNSPWKVPSKMLNRFPVWHVSVPQPTIGTMNPNLPQLSTRNPHPADMKSPRFDLKL